MVSYKVYLTRLHLPNGLHCSGDAQIYGTKTASELKFGRNMKIYITTEEYKVSFCLSHTSCKHLTLIKRLSTFDVF